MADRISFHNVANIKVEKSGKPDNSERSQKIVIEKESGRDVHLVAFGDFEVDVSEVDEL